MSDPDHPLVARLYDPVMALPERTVLREHREFLASDLSGRILDVGAGTGAMFPYFARLDEVSVTAVEPDPYMRSRARNRAAAVDADVQLVDAGAEELPYPDATFDAAVASLVFCTVPDPERALSEVARVLDDGGEFRFLEHVRGEGFAGLAHDALAPAWHAAAGGCNLNRRQDALFLGDDRFRTLEFDRLDNPASRALPLVRGRLKRRPRPPLERLRARLGRHCYLY